MSRIFKENCGLAAAAILRYRTCTPGVDRGGSEDMFGGPATVRWAYDVLRRAYLQASWTHRRRRRSTTVAYSLLASTDLQTVIWILVVSYKAVSARHSRRNGMDLLRLLHDPVYIRPRYGLHPVPSVFLCTSLPLSHELKTRKPKIDGNVAHRKKLME